jgi:hypothetical protein
VARTADAIRGYLTSLPADRFPHLAVFAGLMVEGPPEERFEFGLDVLLSGIVAMRDR